jgi:hypothetical protein
VEWCEEDAEAHSFVGHDADPSTGRAESREASVAEAAQHRPKAERRAWCYHAAP